MQIKRPFLPSFIGLFDSHLLLHKPGIWSARTHLVLFYGLLAMVVITLLCLIVPDDLRKNSTAWVWAFLLSLVSIIGLVIWIRYLLRFNVFKRFGVSGPADRLISFLLYFISVNVIILLPWIKSFVETIQANRAYTATEIVNDANTLNAGILMLEFNKLDHRWTIDTLQVVGSHSSKITRVQEGYEAADTLTIITDGAIAGREKQYVTQPVLERELEKADSFRRMTDSVYVILKAPLYTPLGPYLQGFDSNLLDSRDLYNLYVKNYRAPDYDQQSGVVNMIIDKYVTDESMYPYVEESPLQAIQQKYSTMRVAESMENIMEKKERWDHSGIETFLRVQLYTALILTLLLFTFRHSTPRAFFLSLLAGIILILFTFMSMAFFRHEGSSFGKLMMIYFLIFAAGSVLIFYSPTRNLLTGITLNLLVWILPFIPMIAIHHYYDNRWRENNIDYLDYASRNEVIFIAECAGIVIFLLLLITFVHQAYRKWYAAPVRA